MQMSSRLQILLVEKTLSKKLNPDTNLPYESVAARCILLKDDNSVVTVGRLRVPKSMQPQVKEGTFRAGFALLVRDYGENKGDIVAELTSLVEEPAQRRAADAPAAPAAKG